MAFKLDEHELQDAPLHDVLATQTFDAGAFSAEMVKMAHSIPDSFAVALTCELGTTLVTGDYKFDQTPVDGAPADVSRLAELGRDGLLLLCADSTNADRPGMSPSESSVGPQTRGGVRPLPRGGSLSPARVEHPPRAAGGRRRRAARPQGLAGGPLDAQEREYRPPARPSRSPDGLLVGPKEIEDYPDHKPWSSPRGARASRCPPCAAWPPRPPQRRAARRGHGDLLRHPQSPATSAPWTRRSTTSITSVPT